MAKLARAHAETLHRLGVKIGEYAGARPDVVHEIFSGVHAGMARKVNGPVPDFEELMRWLQNRWYEEIADPMRHPPIKFSPLSRHTSREGNRK